LLPESAPSMSTDLFGVYVHWPFCASKCPYCDFNSHVRESVDHDAWCEALCREIDHYAEMMPNRKVSSIFFGGGTPSLMAPKTVGKVIDKIRERWGYATNHVEITLEANPTSIEADKFKAFREAGVNRVSIGVQSLRDEELKFLGRQHSAEEARKAIQIARDAFERYSIDLIYARPKQTMDAWREELAEAIEEARGHISLYQLTIERGTPFFTQYQRGDFQIPQPDLAADLYELTDEMLTAAGMPCYEVSNYATIGQESAHNLTYWQYDDYVGIGPGAHGRITLENGEKFATRAHRAPEIYLQRVAENGHGAHPFEELNRHDRGVEALMMGLRLPRGVALSKIEAETGAKWQEMIAPDKITALVEEGLLIYDGEMIIPTKDGLQRLNSVLSYLL
jgi:putative oxygen-independent coproporphyrinogen III oxidase